MNPCHLGAIIAKAGICHVFKTTKRKLIKLQKFYYRSVLLSFLPFDVLEGNEVAQARLDFNEPLRASKDGHSMFFSSFQNRCFNDRFWSLDPEQCQSHYRVSEPTAPIEALGGTPPVSHVSIPAIFLGGIYTEYLGAASGLFIPLEFSVTFLCDVLFSPSPTPWKFCLENSGHLSLLYSSSFLTCSSTLYDSTLPSKHSFKGHLGVLRKFPRCQLAGVSPLQMSCFCCSPLS